MNTAQEHPFTEIVLSDGAECYSFENGFDGEKKLRPLSKLNIFVGANNSGKSRLMRALAATEKLRVLPNFRATGTEMAWDFLHSTLDDVRNAVSEFITRTGYLDIDGAREGSGSLSP